MHADEIGFNIDTTYSYNCLTILINNTELFSYHFLNLTKNLASIKEIYTVLKQGKLTEPHYFAIEDDDDTIRFKVSPYQPIDYVILSIPVYRGTKRYCFERKYILQELLRFIDNEHT